MMPTEPHRHLDDEALNAVLDGEATEEQAALASACTLCSARLHRLEQVARALAAPTAPSDGQRRRAAIAAARRAAEPPPAVPTPLAPRRRRRISPAWAAAAAVVAGALAVPLLVDGPAGERQDLATSGESAEDSAGGDTTGDRYLAPGRAGAPTAAAGLEHLGEVEQAGLDELAASIERRPLSADQRSEGAEGALAPPGVADAPCQQAARRNDPSLGPLVYAAEATFSGRPAVVLAFTGADPGGPRSVRVVALDSDSCAELASAPP